MKQTGKRHCLLVSRPAAAGYPPVLNQAEILSECGFAVSIADGSRLNESLGPKKRSFTHYPLGAENVPGSLLGRASEFVTFWRSARRLSRGLRPDLTIAYDVEACAAVKGIAHKHGGLLIWHFHDLWRADAKSVSGKLAIRFVDNHVRIPDLIIIPDEQRAQLFAAETGVSLDKIRVVMNCPRVLRSLSTVPPCGLLNGIVASEAKPVVYNGSVGPHHGLETAIKSVARWPAKAVFLIKGRATSEYDKNLANLISKHGVSDRVLRIPYSEGYGAYIGAHIGWTVLEPVADNWKYSAGASNKRFECMAAGIPQITDNTAGTAKLIEGIGCGLCIPPHSVEGATEAVNRLLDDEALTTAMGCRARAAHLGGLNYETQFEPVVSWVKQRLGP